MRVGNPLIEMLSITSVYLIIKSTSAQAPTSLTSMTPLTPNRKDPLSEFKKGMKRDATLFPILKDEKQWNVYQRAQNTQARAQNLSDVLDDTYVPTTPIDIKLFKLNQEFMYSFIE
jgi:hypothetical protein